MDSGGVDADVVTAVGLPGEGVATRTVAAWLGVDAAAVWTALVFAVVAPWAAWVATRSEAADAVAAVGLPGGVVTPTVAARLGVVAVEVVTLVPTLFAGEVAPWAAWVAEVATVASATVVVVATVASALVRASIATLMATAAVVEALA